MSKKQIAWCAYVIVFVLPSALYFTVNGYWWLFDGNEPIFKKMYASLVVVFFGSFIAGAWADLGRVWKRY